MGQETPTADSILNEACGQVTDKQAERDDWRAVAFAVAERCAAAERRAAEAEEKLARLVAELNDRALGLRLALDREPEER